MQGHTESPAYSLHLHNAMISIQGNAFFGELFLHMYHYLCSHSHTHTPLLVSPQDYSLVIYSHLPNFEHGALQ